jgi:hypothetical protein
MPWIKLLLLTAVTFWWPVTASAQNIELRSGNVQIDNSRERGIYIDSGGTRLYLPPPRDASGSRYWREPGGYQRIHQGIYIRCPSGRTISRQQTTQSTGSGQSTTQTQVHTVQCR